MILDNPNDRALNGLQTLSSRLPKIFQSDIPQQLPPPYSLIAPLAPQRRSRERRPKMRERPQTAQFSLNSFVTYAVLISVLLNCLLVALLFHVAHGSGDRAAHAYAYGKHMYHPNGLKNNRVVRGVDRNATGLNSASHPRRGGDVFGSGRIQERRDSSDYEGQRHRRGSNHR
ncbi:hypothetical protein MVEN_00587200 [Mycena venus]|uniref:Uncharacterized protein n=1 Tax=Mycena venus TaxID=2733690 RepID=A0A8H6YJQ2_9AGAR|nr:hypothetical protein MVEN_00587200 [Mycena venus]